MANPEHVEIVYAGKKAIDEWVKENRGKYPVFSLTMDLSNATFSDIDLHEADLSYTNLRGATFIDVTLWGVRMLGCDLRGANLRGLEITFGNFNGSDITEAHFEESLLSNAVFEDVHCRGAYFNDADLSFTSLAESDFVCCDFRGADLRFAQFVATNLSGSKLDAVKLSAVDSANWDITNVSCSHFYLIDPYDFANYKHGKRIPSEGCLSAGEFEDRFKSRSTIEFVFEHGMNALDPAVLDAAISQANTEHPENNLRLLSLDTRGGTPRAIIEIATQVSKNDVLVLVEAYYQQKLDELHKEIAGLKLDERSLLQLSSKKMLMPAVATKRDVVTLEEFMEECCEEQSSRLLKHRRKSLFAAHRRKAIILPKHIGKWASGKPKYYKASDLKENWHRYLKVLPNLPPLKQ